MNHWKKFILAWRWHQSQETTTLFTIHRERNMNVSNSFWHVLTSSGAGPILPSLEPWSNQQVESKSIAYEMEKCSLIGPGERSRINLMVTMQYKALWWHTSDSHSYCFCFLCYYYLLPAPLILSHLLLLLCMFLITILTMASVAVCIYVSHDISVMCICLCVFCLQFKMFANVKSGEAKTQKLNTEMLSNLNVRHTTVVKNIRAGQGIWVMC